MVLQGNVLALNRRAKLHAAQQRKQRNTERDQKGANSKTELWFSTSREWWVVAIAAYKFLQIEEAQRVDVTNVCKECWLPYL